MNTKGDANRFDRVDAENDSAYFVKFLDARKSNPEEAITKRRILDSLQPLESKRVLDVGCGTGDDLLEIARLVGPQGRVVGIDFSNAMVTEARRRAADSGLPIEFAREMLCNSISRTHLSIASVARMFLYISAMLTKP